LHESTDTSTQINNRTKNAPFSFSFPSTIPNGNLASPNNGILGANLLEDGFSAIVWLKGGLFSGVCWSCAAGTVVGSDSTLSSTEHGGGCMFLFDERERWTGAVIPLTMHQVWKFGLAACAGGVQ